MNLIIFNIDGSFHMATSDIPNEDYLDDSKWIIAELPKGEIFDHEYSYTPVDGVAVKGELIPRDLDEEARLEAEYQATKYQQDRKYPSVGDQLDMIFHAGLGGDEFQATIQAVKDAHPKPTA